MKVENKDFWSKPDVIATQNPEKAKLTWFENRLMTKSKTSFMERSRTIGRIHIVGCGPGREIPAIKEAFPDSKITASDISDKMIEECRKNMDSWNTSDIGLQCAAASEIEFTSEKEDIIMALNSILTYVTPLEEREKTLKHLFNSMSKGGLFIGVVHHRYGRVDKTLYFMFRSLLRKFGLIKGEVGDRVGGFSGFEVPCHYYEKYELKQLLKNSGFKVIFVKSLYRFAKHYSKSYNPLTSYNNLLFMARKD